MTTINKIKQSTIKTGKILWQILPTMLGVILFISLISVLISKSFYIKIFSKSVFLDLIIGNFVGSISTGNPIIGYILGGEFLSQGISILAVTAFLVSWVTVGFVQLPIELQILGKRFAILRNISAFIFSIIIAIITTLILKIF